MSEIIRISENLYKRLAQHARGFETPAQVIENILNYYEVNNNIKSSTEENPINEMSHSLEIIYHPNNDKDNFKRLIIKHKKVYIKLYKINGGSEVKLWRVFRFTENSDIANNLRSGYLRGWRKKGIVKAELSINRADFQDK